MHYHYIQQNHMEPQQLLGAFLSVIATMVCSVTLIVSVYICIDNAMSRVDVLMNPRIIEKAKVEDFEP